MEFNTLSIAESTKRSLRKKIPKSLIQKKKSGKSTLALIISQYLAEKNHKVLLIDGDLEKQDLSIILKNIK